MISSETELASLPKQNCLPQQSMEEAKDETIADEATAEEATKDTTVEKVEKCKRRDKIVTKGALVRNGFYICNSCEKPVCQQHNNIARAFRRKGHKNCEPELKL